MSSNHRCFVAVMISIPILHGCNTIRPMSTQYGNILVVCLDKCYLKENYGVDSVGIEDRLAGDLTIKGYSVVERAALDTLLEQIHLGPNKRYGFKEFLDPA